MEDLIYGAMRVTADAEREKIQTDMKELLQKNGIDIKDTTDFSFTVSMDGAIKVDSVSLNLEKSDIEEILNQDKGLALRMVKNTAMFKLQDYNYDENGTGSRAEMALVNVELQEKFGYGLSRLAEQNSAASVWGFDPNLDAAMTEDVIFQEQVFTYMNTSVGFEAEWSFGNEHVADKTNSARSFLPSQGIGTFAENLYMDLETIDSEVKFSLTPEGLHDVKDASPQNGEYTAEEKQDVMDKMEGLLSQGAINGGLEQLKEASKRAMEEHLVKNGGMKENLEVVITARSGRWSLEVVEKPKIIKPSEEEEEGEEEVLEETPLSQK